MQDFINRYQTLQGRKVKYVPGWDCHGLPIELKVLQSMKDEERKALTPIKLRQKVRLPTWTTPALLGKMKPSYCANRDVGDVRMVVSADKVHVHLTLSALKKESYIRGWHITCRSGRG